MDAKLLEALAKGPQGEMFVAHDHVFVPKMIIRGSFAMGFFTRNYLVFSLSEYELIKDKMELPDVEVLIKIE